MYKNYSELGIKPEQNQDQYSVLELKSADERMQLIQSHRLVCIDIYADWCGPCKQTAPAYSVIATKYNKPGMVAVVKLNWDVIGKEERNNINGIPLFLFYLDGKLVDNIIGADLAEVENKLKMYSEKLASGPEVSRGPQHTRNTIRTRRTSAESPQFEENSNPQQGYPQQGYPQQGYPQQGMPQFQQGRPQQGMPQGHRQQNVQYYQ
jgi:thiol-disulfide isomerase/thioredoxin